jgi:hypothetical protein
MTESYLQSQIKKALEAINCLVIKTDPPPIGLPDLLVSYAPGRHIWIEVKTPTGKLSKAQIAYHAYLRKNYQETVYIARSVEEAINQIELKRLSEKSDITDNQTA